MIYKLKQLAFSLLILSIISFTLLPLNTFAIHSCEHADMNAQTSPQPGDPSNTETNHCDDDKQVCSCDNCDNCGSHLASSVYIDLIEQGNGYSRHQLDNKVQINHPYSQPFSNPLLRPPII